MSAALCCTVLHSAALMSKSAITHAAPVYVQDKDHFTATQSIDSCSFMLKAPTWSGMVTLTQQVGC
ncbi:hypothetical protein ACVWZB_004761 [Paenibacillus polymyxa]